MNRGSALRLTFHGTSSAAPKSNKYCGLNQVLQKHDESSQAVLTSLLPLTWFAKGSSAIESGFDMVHVCT